MKIVRDEQSLEKTSVLVLPFLPGHGDDLVVRL
jgi:hypothetical protein